MRTRTTPIVAALVATASLAGGAAPADAYYLRNTDKAPDVHPLLRFPPKVPGFRPCIDDTVTLPPGTYWHGAYIVSQAHRSNPDLENAPKDLVVSRRTTYSWKVCRGWNPNPNPDSFDPAAYQVRSTLFRRGSEAHTVLMTFQNEVGGRSFLYGNGNYEWGGRIERACNGCTSPSR
jgi:hypothetical protein